MKPFKCKHCGAALGNTDGAFLQIANCIFRRVLTLECVNCGQIREWRPCALELAGITLTVRIDDVLPDGEWRMETISPLANVASGAII